MKTMLEVTNKTFRRQAYGDFSTAPIIEEKKKGHSIANTLSHVGFETLVVSYIKGGWEGVFQAVDV